METLKTKDMKKYIDFKNSIYNILNQNIEINITLNNENGYTNPINISLNRILNQRRIYAMTYINSNLDDENKKYVEEIISKLNEEIIKIIGLYTL